MGGVWCWIFFSRGFQHTFLFKTVAKALDHDLGFSIVLYMGQHAHFLCACDRVQPPLHTMHECLNTLGYRCL